MCATSLFRSISQFIRGLPENANLRLLLSEERRKAMLLEAELNEANAKIKNLELDKKEQADEIEKLKKIQQYAKRNRPRFAESSYDPFNT